MLVLCVMCLCVSLYECVSVCRLLCVCVCVQMFLDLVCLWNDNRLNTSLLRVLFVEHCLYLPFFFLSCLHNLSSSAYSMHTTFLLFPTGGGRGSTLNFSTRH